MSKCLAALLLAAGPLRVASADLLRAGRAAAGETRVNKTDSTFVPIWAIAAPWLAEDTSNSNAAQSTVRRRRARDRDREVDGYVSDEDRYDNYEKLRGSVPEPRSFEPVRTEKIEPALRRRRTMERQDTVARTVEREHRYDDTYESDRFERDRFEEDGERDSEVRSMNNHRYFRQTRNPVHKLGLAVVNALGFGVFGVDRCLFGQVEVGIIKAITLGGCGIWFLIDWIVITVNCLMFWHSINTMGLDAEFEKGTIQLAFWAALFFLILKMCLSGWETNRRGKAAHAGM